MGEPDFQELSETSIWPAQRWADAWSTLRESEPNETRREIIWSAVLTISPINRPDNIVASLLQALNS